MPAVIDAQLADFLYWHGVSKMRMAEFADAEALFRYLHSACPARTEAGVGRIYCLLRLGEVALASELVASLRRDTLVPIQVALLGRLQRRCEFERTRAATAQKARHGRSPVASNPVESVRMPHTLGDDQMARLAAEQL